ncbi:MAG: laccase domain protein [Phycisphaerae bacterium]|nr:MAG: laccase domain protein [Phycisphaerae bacterium]
MTATRHQYANAGWSPPTEPSDVFWQSLFVNKSGGVHHVFAPLGYNISSTSGNDTDSTHSRRDKACAAVGSSIEQLVCAKQAHDQNIAIVTAADGNRVFDGMDGFVTSDSDVAIMAFTADCPIVMVCDTAHNALGLAHSGWKGSCLNVAAKLVAAMTDTAGANAPDAWAVVGPCAGACCYEIKDDVAQQVEASAVNPARVLRRESDIDGESKLYLDLPVMIAMQLEHCGIAPERIALPTQCTICDTRFFSYRRQGPNAGQAALLARIAD